MAKRSNTLSPMAIPHRGRVSGLGENTPNGIFQMVKSLFTGTSTHDPEAFEIGMSLAFGRSKEEVNGPELADSDMSLNLCAYLLGEELSRRSLQKFAR
jgi:hypothetical protein